MARALQSLDSQTQFDTKDHQLTAEQLKIYATADIGEALQRLRDRGYSVEVYSEPESPPHSLIVDKVGSGIAALITTLRDKIDEPVFAAGASSLRVVAQMAVGVDNIDREAANRFRIPFTNTPDVLTQATAEFALFILGAVSRRLYASENLVRQNDWQFWHPFIPILGDEVTGKTITVIGVGRIGKAFAQKCVGLDTNLLLCTNNPDQKFAEFIDKEMALRYEAGFSRERATVRFAAVEEGLAKADYVSLHVPLIMPGGSKKPTYHLINEQTINLMKRSAYLINTSRGPVVDETALCRALLENKIAGAALDVFDREPLPADSLLRDSRLRDRVRLFHHFASGTRETRLSTDPEVGMAGRTVQAVIDILEDRYDADPCRMPYVVNKEAFVQE